MGAEASADVARGYLTDFITSDDGTTIGYRQFGHGPGLLLLHGGLMTSQNFMQLAVALSDAFTVYVPDRRGRGLSGPFGAAYGMKKECEDVDMLLRKTDTHNVFGLSSGALIALQAALTLPAINKVALYEPPLLISGYPVSEVWVERYEREIARGNLAAAMASIIKGTGDSSIVSLPRFLLVPLMRFALWSEARQVKDDQVPLQALIPTMHYDQVLVKEMRGTLERFQTMTAEVLLLGGNKSQAYLRAALDSLNKVLPHIRRVELLGVGHLAANNDGKPERVAQELLRFFGESSVAL